MRYAATKLEHGRRPAMRCVDEDYVPGAGEIIVDGRVPEEEVWDASSGSLRPSTPAERLAVLKEEKEAELIRAADAEEQAIWTAEIEFKYVLIKRLLGQQISGPQQQKALDVLALFERLEQKVGAVRRAKTEAEVEGVSWA